MPEIIANYNKENAQGPTECLKEETASLRHNYCQAVQHACKQVLDELRIFQLTRASGHFDHCIEAKAFKPILDKIQEIHHIYLESHANPKIAELVIKSLVEPIREQIIGQTLQELHKQIENSETQKRTTLKFHRDMWNDRRVCPFETLSALLNTEGQTKKRKPATPEEHHCIEFLKSIWKKHHKK